jgi:D-arabinose 1-dehydrogenase-like Zn-dependent alcohol dehydrogenase
MKTYKNYKAWVAKAAKQPLVLEVVDLGPLGAEEVEVAVEFCGMTEAATITGHILYVDGGAHFGRW